VELVFLLQLLAELERLKSEHTKTCKTVRDLKTKLQIITEQKDVYQSRNRELMQGMENSPWYRELKDTVYHLQEQLKAATEDFQNERRDREHAQGRIAEIEVELAYYKRYEVSNTFNQELTELNSSMALVSTRLKQCLQQKEQHHG
jgi:chromosome segregation ATPase